MALTERSEKNSLGDASALGMKAALVGIVVNLRLALGKCTAGFLGNSFALVADGLESAADVITGLAVYFGLKIAAKPPDANHPYGHGKAEPIAALTVGISLIAAAIAIIFESIHGIITPHPAPAPYTLIVLAGVLVRVLAISDVLQDASYPINARGSVDGKVRDQ